MMQDGIIKTHTS